MTRFRTKISLKIMLRVAALSTAGLTMSGCYTTFGDDYYDDGYSSYACDPYSAFDSYYDCDYGQGFYNIGFGGGWYDSFWYPGYGFYLFDNYGRRYPMRENQRRYWGERRHHWYRQNHDGSGYGHGNGGHGGQATPGPNGDQGNGNWGRGNRGPRTENPEGRPRDAGSRRRIRDGQQNERPSANATPVPAPAATPAPARGDGRRDGLRRRIGNEDGSGTVNGPRQRRDGDGRNYRQPSQQNNSQSAAPVATPAPRSDNPRPTPTPRRVRRNDEAAPD